MKIGLTLVLAACLLLAACGGPSNNMKDMSAKQLCVSLGVPEKQCIA
jgi:hypothetical protein